MFDPKAFLKTLTTHPGVYQMLNQDGDVLYVGKARNLKKRVSSYFQRESTHAKTVSLVKQICGIEVIVTSSETEALLLENNLIKKFRPRYNVLFRDDKSYPYIFISSGLNFPPFDSEDRPAQSLPRTRCGGCAGRSHEQFRLMRQKGENLNPSPLDYPRLDFYRGIKGNDGRYFGPYPSSAAVRESIYLIQRLFKLRQCRDHFFRHRSRPCLQYYIKRCSAPCVGYIDPVSYQESVRQTILFLEGKNQEVINQFVAHMEAASEALDFELAAHYRDQIAQLRQIQSRQYVSGSGGEADVIAAILEKNTACIQLLSIRAGQLVGSKVFFQTLPASMTLEELLSAFVSQHYGEIPPLKKFEVIVNINPADSDWLAEALSLKITPAVRGERKRWVSMAINNAQQALSAHLAHNTHQAERIALLQEALQLEVLPQRLECMDISHTMGEATVGSCVVFDTEGPVKSDYRRFNITDITPGDDYAAMRQVLMRRYTRLKNNDGKLPDILFIDGGKGQLRQAEEVLEELQVSGVTLIGIAKGEGRKPGLETLFVSGRPEPYHLKSDSPALHLIQHIRDEAHRFAIAGHRNRRAKARITSPLENIPGIGAKRRRELLRQFGGLSELKGASIEEIAKVPGISRDLAERIYAVLHN